MKMKQIFPYSLILILVILLMRDCRKEKSSYDPKSQKTETIYSQKPWIPSKPFEIIQNPKTLIWFYGIKDTSNIKPYKEVKLEKDSVILYTDEFTKLGINKNYLLLFPEADKLISFDLCNSELELNLLDINGKVFQKNYQIDLDSYKYRYTNNIFSVERINKVISRRLHIEPILSYQFRPFNNFHDLTLSLKFKTKTFNYEIGLNSSYYPSISKKIHKDLLLGISYNF